MMQCEFEKLIGYEITPEEYEKVEFVYMAWDYKEMSKEQIAHLYSQDRNLVIVTLYNLVKSMTKTAFNLCKELSECKARNEELETQLRQYKALFADIEKNMTVSLYETLLGVTE